MNTLALAPYFRQGDVIITPMATPIPETATHSAPKPLALGEVTGHRHEVVSGDVEFYTDKDGRVYLHVDGEDGAMVAHGTPWHLNLFKNYTPVDLVEEDVHGPIVLPAGNYEVNIQVEYSPQGWTQVQD